jgi:hypothetical protein
MTTPDESKTLRVSPETHALVMAHARRIRGTVDEAVTDLADESTVRIPMGDIQRSRWELEAAKRGIRLGDYIRFAVEANMTYDPRTINQTFYRVEALCQVAGIAPEPTPQESAKTAKMRIDPAKSGPQQ